MVNTIQTILKVIHGHTSRVTTPTWEKVPFSIFPPGLKALTGEPQNHTLIASRTHNPKPESFH